MEVEGPSASFLGVKVDLPHLAQRVGLDEVALVVDMEAVVDGMVFQLGHIAGHVDGGHGPSVGHYGRLVTAAPAELLEVLRAAAGAVRGALDALDDWGPAGPGGAHPGQYHSDVAADAAALAVLDGAGLGVLSEETGLHNEHRPVLVVIDPVDGSTNAARRLPWYATSLCALDAEGPLAAVVVNQATGEAFEAVRGAGAFSAGRRLAASGCTSLGSAVVGLAGWPPRHGGWKQMRALGAAALDLCAVAAGRLDAYVDFSWSAHGSWDYLGGMLVCQEAGATVVDAWGRDLLSRDHGARRTPVAAATPELLAALVDMRTADGQAP